MITATAHLKDEDIYQELLKDALDWLDKDMVKEVFKKILKLTDPETRKKAVRDARRYILNNRHGIEIKAEKGDEIVGCSAEGHVSHVFSNRLSSRPKGWSEIGLLRCLSLLSYIRKWLNIFYYKDSQK